jgi:hypothetical protein
MRVQIATRLAPYPVLKLAADPSGRPSGQLADSSTSAIPWPPPMHIVTRP